MIVRQRELENWYEELHVALSTAWSILRGHAASSRT